MLKGFRTYLQKHQYAETTIESYCDTASKFINWCNINRYEVETINYKQWSEYQNLLKNRITKTGKKPKSKTVKHIIGILRLFFDYMVHDDIMALNPIKEIQYKSKDKFYHQLLSEEELQELYFCFPTLNLEQPQCTSAAIRNKVLVGLAIYQGIETEVLKHLTINNIDLNKGRIQIPGTKRSNGRKLQLKQVQINILRQYLEHDRVILQKKINCYTEALFPLNGTRYSSMTNDICGKLKMINLRVTNFRQIRSSVITLWTEKHDLRKAQIMAGHRYISSTEKYQKSDLSSQEEAVARYHPIQ